jgi:hypothetical protein
MMASGSTFSVIGADVVIKGDIAATADLHVDGTIEGDIKCASLVQGEASVAGPDVREGLGDRVDLTGRKAERGTGVADGVTHSVGVHHRHAGAALFAEALEDPVVDLLAARGLDVDVDVRQFATQR